MVIRLQGPRDKDNGFKRAKQTTMIRYINLQESYDSIIETEFVTIYSRDNNDHISKKCKRPEYSREHESLEYVVEVEHNYKSASLLDFGATINIVPKKCAMIHQH
jgi:hypothetical protein